MERKRLSEYLDGFVYTDIQSDQDQPEYLRAPGLIDIIDFGNMLSRLFRDMTLPDDYWRADTRVVVTPEYPNLEDTSTTVPMIVWDVIARSTFPTDIRPRKRNVSEFEVDRFSDTVNEHMVQRFNNIFELACIDKDNYHASRLQEFLEDFIEVHIGLFQLAGVGAIEYEGRTNDRVLSYRERVRDEFAVRTTRYRIETQTIRIVPIARLQEVEITLQSGFSVMLNERVTRTSAQYDTLSRERAFLIKQVVDSVDQVHSTYKKDTDYYLSDNKIYWNDGERAPTIGETYFVTYLYSESIEFSDTAPVLM
jgi:hypothetical protein